MQKRRHKWRLKIFEKNLMSTTTQVILEPQQQIPLFRNLETYKCFCLLLCKAWVYLKIHTYTYMHIA